MAIAAVTLLPLERARGQDWGHPRDGGGWGMGREMGGPDDGRGQEWGMAGPMDMTVRRRGGPEMMMRDPVAGLLDHQTLLRLTPSQVNTIIGIDDKLHADDKPLFDRLMDMRRRRGPRGPGGEMGGPPGGGAGAPGSGPNPDELQARRDSAMTTVRAIRENVWRATAAADAVLTPEQLATAGTLDPDARGGMRPPNAR